MHGWESTTGSKVSQQVPAEKGLRANCPRPLSWGHPHYSLPVSEAFPSPAAPEILNTLDTLKFCIVPVF